MCEIPVRFTPSTKVPRELQVAKYQGQLTAAIDRAEVEVEELVKRLDPVISNSYVPEPGGLEVLNPKMMPECPLAVRIYELTERVDLIVSKVRKAREGLEV